MSQIFQKQGGYRKCRTPWCYQEVRGREDKHFCSPRCKAAYHNEQRRQENRTIYSYEALMRQNEKLLRGLHANSHFRKHGLSREVLLGEGVNLSICCSIEEHTTTRGTILWYGCYGVEQARDREGHYLLHRREKEKVVQYPKVRRRYA